MTCIVGPFNSAERQLVVEAVVNGGFILHAKSKDVSSRGDVIGAYSNADDMLDALEVLFPRKSTLVRPRVKNEKSDLPGIV